MHPGSASTMPVSLAGRLEFHEALRADPW